MQARSRIFATDAGTNKKIGPVTPSVSRLLGQGKVQWLRDEKWSLDPTFRIFAPQWSTNRKWFLKTQARSEIDP
jgi:hypothetical protein